MTDTKEQIQAFLDKCDEAASCKFIMATTKIKDLLKCIANSGELYSLFSSVTENFDYPAMKANCLVTVSDTLYERSYLTLPQNASQTLAFIFCLLIEFDSDTINFNDFLRRYYPEDGSYYASYRAFCSVIIKSLRDIVAATFADALSAAEEVPQQINAEISQILSVIEILLSEEVHYIDGLAIDPVDKEGGFKILSAINSAVKAGNIENIDALVCGYNYFVLHNNCISDTVAQLVEAIGEYERLI